MCEHRWSSCSCFKSFSDSADAVVDGFGDAFPDAALGACSANGTGAVALSLSDVRPFPFKYSNSLSEIDPGSSRPAGEEMSSAGSSEAVDVLGFWPPYCDGAMLGDGLVRPVRKKKRKVAATRASIRRGPCRMPPRPVSVCIARSYRSSMVSRGRTGRGDAKEGAKTRCQ